MDKQSFNVQNSLELALSKISNQSVSFQNSFKRLFEILVNQKSGYILEKDVEPLKDIPNFKKANKNPQSWDDSQINALKKTAVIKLNGGLGTTMGLNKAKSLLEVKDGLTFLDIILKQLEKIREITNAELPLIFMNSFRTSDDTREFLQKYAASEASFPLEFVQHLEPKLRADNFEPVNYPSNPELEWCPPGHGDFYSSFFDSNVLAKLIEQGYKYAFVSNADNLGAIVNAEIAEYFANSEAEIMLELADKTEDDIKGGHIVKDRLTNKLLLREVAQITKEDLPFAFNLEIHPYFNTNSIWLNLEALNKHMLKTNGVLELPLIKNLKNVDPNDKNSTEVIQIESAIGAGINAFEKGAVININRERFLPVKTNKDLETLRSDNFKLNENFELIKQTAN